MTGCNGVCADWHQSAHGLKKVCIDDRADNVCLLVKTSCGKLAC